MRRALTLTAAALSLAIGLSMSSVTASAMGAGNLAVLKGAAADNGVVEKAGCWRRCWWHHGHRHCRWVCRHHRWRHWHRY